MALGYVDDFDASADNAPDGQISVTFEHENGPSSLYILTARNAFELAAKIQHAATQAMIAEADSDLRYELRND